ncbi:MAG: preprotein translocase subunit SecG [Candidatus Malihini olakiniferum]
MYEVLLIIFLLVAFCLTGLIMLQKSNGADMGTSFGSAAPPTMFGSNCSGNFTTLMIAALAILFFVFSLALGNMSSHQGKSRSEWDKMRQPATPVAPASKIPK